MPPDSTLSPAPARVWPPWARGPRAAAVLLTRLPLGGFPYSDHDWRWAAAYLPLIGAALGGIQALVWLGLARAGGLVAGGGVIVVSLLVTGALHEDGLADTSDALGGGGPPARILAILKDSRIGAFGAAALAVSIPLRMALLARLAPIAPAVLIFSECASRVMPVWLMTTLPYVTVSEGAKNHAVVRASGLQAFVATGLALEILGTLVALSGIPWPDALIALGLTALSGLYLRLRFRARVGGITGDFLGATQQVGLVVILLTLAIAQGGPP